MITHNFHQSLAFCERHQSFAYPLYQKVFGGEPRPATQRMEQIRGVDVVVESMQRTWTIEEKVRTKQYGDIFLEYASARELGTPGWIAKNLVSDYLAYIVLEDKSVRLFPFPLLRQAWIRNGENWKRKYGEISVPNGGQFGTYTTLGVCVPVDVVWDEITKKHIKAGHGR